MLSSGAPAAGSGRYEADRHAAAPAAAAPAEPPQRLFDQKTSGRRPKLLGALYGSYAALQAADVQSTLGAIRRGGRELNPVAGSFVAQPASLVAFKAVSTATTIYFVERIRRKSGKAAAGVMLALNGATAAVVAHNLRRRHVK
ncbi:MAG: DUF5658 family protein [Vicinamibacterales bacterium]